MQASNISQRQNAQSGRFILFPNRIECGNSNEGGGYMFQNRIEPIDKNGDDVVARIIIPAGSKKKIINSLKAVSITEGSLFPDDLDRVCRGIVEGVAGNSNAYRRIAGKL